MDTAVTKKWYQSKTIWAIFIGFIALIASQVGVTDPSLPASPDVAQAVDYVHQVQAAKGSVTQIISVAISAIAFAFGVYGRIKADTAIATGSTSAA